MSPDPDSRPEAIAAFLAHHGYGAARATPLAQDASLRRYLRLSGGLRPAVLMDAPPPEDVRPFLRIAAHLAAIGLSVPEIIAADERTGLLLEEDLGDDLFPAVLTTGSAPALLMPPSMRWSRCSARPRRSVCPPGTPRQWHRRPWACCSTGGGQLPSAARRHLAPGPTSPPPWPDADPSGRRASLPRAP